MRKFVSIAIAAFGMIAASGLPGADANATTLLSGEMTVDNAFFAYLGTSATSLGVLVGSGNYWPSAFSLTPTALTPGVTNYLNIEGINYGGPGGLSTVLNLSNSGFMFGNGSQVLTTDPVNLSSFSASYNDANSAVTPQPWVPATGPVIQDTGYPWGNVVGTANWADAAGFGLNDCGYCTVDFTVAIIPSAVPEPSSWAMMLLGFAAIGVLGYRKAVGGQQRIAAA